MSLRKLMSAWREVQPRRQIAPAAEGLGGDFRLRRSEKFDPLDFLILQHQCSGGDKNAMKTGRHARGGFESTVE